MLGANLGSILVGDVSVMLKWLWSSDAKMSKIKKKMQREIVMKVIHLVNSVSVHVCLHSYNVSSKYLE